MVIDTTELVLIPSGRFPMGSEEGNSNELPVREIEVSSFYLDRHVVTNSQFRRFIIANPNWEKDEISQDVVDGDYLNIWNGNIYPSGLDDYSVINISWHAAKAYAEWAGKRLPTEAEWEYAAGGRDHFKWSLGNTFDERLYSFAVLTDPIGFPVMSLPANTYGLYEMSGGVWEWVEDSYEVDAYLRIASRNPLHRAGVRRSLRGGASTFESPSYVRCSVRGSNDPTACHEDYGFRCAMDAQ
ncbi:MAG TPA: formylglycine-generating enzyme family protein [Pyrinomonadaceae bacterium]|nr:formylglycine-generating enzyme family protein [Pyrinomonadaceae bacterium]